MSGPAGSKAPEAPTAGSARATAAGAAGGVGAAPVVTLIVPMLNERRRIRGCLASLLAQDYPLDRVEILLVDGMSTDGTREIVQETIAAHPGAGLRLVDNPKRIPAAAMNLGIQQARGAYLMRLDAHCEAAPDFIHKTIEALERTGAACVGGAVESVGEGRTARAVALAMSSPFGVGNAHFRYGRQERDVDAVAFGAYRRTVFDEIGLYDEDLVYSEDNELNDRLTRRGRRIVLVPEIRVRYYTRETLGALWRQYFRYGRGRTRYMVRAPRSIRLRHLAPFALIASLVATSLLGIVYEPFWAFFVGILALWLAAAVAATWRIGRARGGDALPLVPAAFFCQHFGYGAGQCAGLLSLPRRNLPSRRS